MTETEVRANFPKYSFYHSIDLTPTLSTPGEPALVGMQQIPLSVLRSVTLEGKRVLDVGCRDGLFSFEAERRGASEVVGIDNDLSRAAVELLIPFLRSNVRMLEMNVMALQPESFGLFDVVLFFGVLYHLRYPFWGLRNVSSVVGEGGLLILETAVLLDDDRKAMLYCPTGDDGPYEPTSVSFFNFRGLKDTLNSFGLRVERVSMEPKVSARARAHCTRAGILKDLLRELTGRRRPDVGRATLLCRRVGTSMPWELDAYWNKTHSVHTDMYLAERKKRFSWLGD